MKTEFKAKFLQHVAKKRKEEGFTLIELLVVIIIIGILSAIALPSFLNQANKAKQSEAKQYIASIGKGQQSYFVENNTFIHDMAEIGKLGLGIKTATNNYTYEINGADPEQEASAWTKEAAGPLAGYVGVAFIDTEGTSQTILCEGPTAVAGFNVFTATDCEDATGFTKAL